MNDQPKKKILFYPFLTYGHVNVCAALGNRLLHLYPDQIEIIFLQNEKYAAKAQELCPGARIVTYLHPYDEMEDADKSCNGMTYINAWFQEFGKIWTIHPLSDRLNAMATMFKTKFEAVKVIYDRVRPLLDDIKPDLVFYDQLMTTPIGQDLGCPWGLIMSSAPTYFGHWQLPPPISGLPGNFTPENVTKWESFIDETYRGPHLRPLLNELNLWLKQRNCPNLDGHYSFYTPSPFLNIYNYPQELDYQTSMVRLPGHWARLESAVQQTATGQYKISAEFERLPGRLVYVSLGSMASAYLPLMKRLLEQLRSIQHKFIVSLGPLLPLDLLQGNLTGDRFVDQQTVLNTVDVMISHGGNNSLTECFHYGVPMIVLPLFGDQPDNAQRVHETGYGFKFDAFQVTSQQLNDAINSLVDNEQLRQKLRQASERIKKDNGLSAASHEVASLICLEKPNKK